MTPQDKAAVARATGAPPTTPDGRAIHFPGQPADAAPPEGAKQLIESGSTTVQSGSGSSSSTSSSFQRSLGPDPKIWQRYQDALDRKTKADAEVVQVQAEASKDIEAKHQRIAYEKELEAMHLAGIDAETEQRLKPINDKMMATLDAYQNGKVDPGRIWKDAGTAGQIGAAIAVAMGAIAQGMKGGPNQAWDVIQGAIDRDVQLQMADLEKKRGEVGMLAQLGREVLAQGGDRKMAESAIRAASIQVALARIQGIAARADAAMGPDGRSYKYDQILAVGKAMAERESADVSERMRGQVAGQSTRQTQTSSQVSKTHIDREMVDAPSSDDDGSQQLMFGGVRYKLGKYVDNSEGKDLRAKMVQIDTMLMNARKLKELRKELGEKLYASKQYTLLSNQIAAAGSTLQGMGVLQENEREEYQRIFDNFRSGPEAIQQMEDLADRIGRGILDQSNAKPLGSGGGGGVTVVGRQGTKKGKH
jgi:hypothetical protein